MVKLFDPHLIFHLISSQLFSFQNLLSLISQPRNDILDITIFFNHFLVMAMALLRGSALYLLTHHHIHP